MIDPYFHIIPFLLGLVVGVILFFVYKDQKITIIDYPKPNDNNVYTDKNNVKFRYSTKIVDCDKNESTLKYYPLQN